MNTIRTPSQAWQEMLAVPVLQVAAHVQEAPRVATEAAESHRIEVERGV